MSVFQVVIFFIFGFILGGLFVWFLRKSEINTIKKNNDELKSAFGNLSKEALDQNLSTFLKIAEDKFKDLAQKSDGNLEQKKDALIFFKKIMGLIDDEIKTINNKFKEENYLEAAKIHTKLTYLKKIKNDFKKVEIEL